MSEDKKPKGSDVEIIKLGRNLVYNLFVLLKTAKNYKYGHSAMNSPIARIQESLSTLEKKNEDSDLMIKRGYLFLGEQRLKPDSMALEPFTYTIDTMKNYSIGKVNFDYDVNADSLGKFAYIFQEIEPGEPHETFQNFTDKMQHLNIVGIEIDELPETEAEGFEVEEEDPKEQSKRLYAKTLNAVSEVMDDVRIGKTLKLKKSKRVVQGMIDQLLTAESNLLGLTTIRCHDEYTYHHSVNVCILSLVIGQRIGMDKATLCDLGLAALFHDIGKSDVPLEILNKPSSFTEDEWQIMQSHPLHGVKQLMKLKGLDTLSARIIAGAFEHHINVNHSGYPKVPYKRDLSLFGRIIAIADCYDGVTSSRVYSRTPMSPDKALKFMMDKAGTIYDAVLMKLFVNSVGVYPIGSLLLLNTRELAVVIQSNPDPENWNAPMVKIICDENGNEIDGQIMDLSLQSNNRTISQTMDPEKHKVDVSKYFL